MRTLIIGRSQFADIKIADASVAPRHAELVVTADSRYHLTDCGSGARTSRAVPSEDGEERWEDVRQAFVGSDQPLCFGVYRCSVNELLRRFERGAAEGDGGGSGRSPSGALADQARERVRGRVERDPKTGEIVRRRT